MAVPHWLTVAGEHIVRKHHRRHLSDYTPRPRLRHEGEQTDADCVRRSEIRRCQECAANLLSRSPALLPRRRQESSDNRVLRPGILRTGRVAPVCGTAPSAKVDGASTRDVGSIIVVIATDAPLTRATCPDAGGGGR